MQISLKPVTRETVRAVCALDAGDRGAQVAPNAVSIAQAYFQREAWFRSIYAADELVGFVMLYDPTLVSEPEEREFFLWRLMIDRAFQGRGFGRGAVERLIEHVKTRPGAVELLVSHVEAAEALGRFYTSLGFRYTGKVDDGEKVMVRAL